jgi:catechol 2,3-dioxygenase-like lactoylglutathione lyase family enzyme
MGKKRDRKRETECRRLDYGDRMNRNPILPLTRLDQIGIAVRDVDQAVAFMSQSFGIEFLTMEMPRAEAFLGGKKVQFIPRIGIAKVGEIDLERIQILEGDHIVKESLCRHGPGLHHLGVYVDNLQTAVELWKKAGGKVVQETAHPDGVGTVYLDTEDELGNDYIELIKL